MRKKMTAKLEVELVVQDGIADDGHPYWVVLVVNHAAMLGGFPTIGQMEERFYTREEAEEWLDEFLTGNPSRLFRIAEGRELIKKED